MDFHKIISESDKKPQSILKIVLLFSVILLFIWLFLVSNMELSSSSQPKAESTETSLRTQGLKSSLLDPEAPENTQEAEVSESEEAPNLFQNAFITFLVMMTVLGGVWMWARKKEKNPSKDQDTREIGGYKLDQNAQLKFVEINNEVWVIALSSGSVNLLHRVPKEEWTEEEKPDSTAASSSQDFKSLYKFFKN